jgi:hypothetical protein
MEILPYCPPQALFLSVIQEVDFKIPLTPFFKEGKRGKNGADRFHDRPEGVNRHHLIFF